MRPWSPRTRLFLALLASLTFTSLAQADPPMQYVGSLNPYPGTFATYGTVAVDTDRHVAYMAGAFSDRGVAAMDISDPSHPVLVYEIPNPGPIDQNNSPGPDDVDLVGRYLAVSHHPNFGLQAFRGVAIYDTQPDPFHPTLLHAITMSTCGLESAQLDPEVGSGRPYVYCNSHCLFDPAVYIANILTGQIIGTFIGPEPFGCPPFPCAEENAPHEAFVQRHPRSGKMLDYVGYWDSGLRILDVTDPTHPVEAGAFDYGPGTGYRNAHGAVASPSGDYVYVGDEFGFDQRGGIHVFDARTCDGTSHCTPTPIAFWQRQSPDAGAPPPVGPFFASFVAFDVHNMFPLGENGLLVANYRLGVRLLDVTDKTNPNEISFYLPNNNDGVADDPNRPLFVGRRTYNAVRGKDGLIYGGDITYGLFVASLNPLTQLPAGAAAFARGARGGGELTGVRVSIGRSTPVVSFSTRKPGRSTLTIYDISGRLVATVVGEDRSAGAQRLMWNARAASGARVASGVYLGRLSTPDGETTVKVVRLD